MIHLDSLQGVFRDAFDCSTLSITPDTNASNLDGWDSFNHINLIVGLEAAYGVRIATQEIGKLTSVERILRFLEEKGVQR